MTRLALVIAVIIAAPVTAAEPWSTYRGNAQRTGNTDNQPGPAAPKVLWSMPSTEHFVASPVPFGDSLFVSGLGAFNVPTFYCLPQIPKVQVAAKWSKSTPVLKLPTVSSPAIAGDKLVFGDGMHQTDGGVLYCVFAETGKPLWQYPVPGEIKDNPVHLEGSPTVAGSRVFFTGGGAGVFCVDLNDVTLDGKPLSTEAVQMITNAKWKELQRKYEEDKKKDPDFAVEPREDMLPKPAPNLMWQQGKAKWHVDAPLSVAGDNVLVASAYLDKEKTGDRALFCLDATTGKEKWRTPLPLNPWGGPSVDGNTVVLAGSNIGYSLQALKGAKGDVAAFDLITGKEKWRKEVKGGVVGSVALADGLAVLTATDGKVRAYDNATGELRWNYDAKTPFFAAPAVAGGVVYAGDLTGVVHAIGLKDGVGKWKLDLGKDPTSKAPGMIYGGPVVHGGKVFVATCNLEGPNAGKPTCVVCIGAQ